MESINHMPKSKSKSKKMKEQQINIYLAKLGNTKEQFIKDEDYAT